jgi:hypothetical protein
VTPAEHIRRRAREYELLAEWHVERAAGDPRYGDAADSLVAIAIVLHELADLFDDELLHREAA